MILTQVTSIFWQCGTTLFFSLFYTESRAHPDKVFERRSTYNLSLKRENNKFYWGKTHHNRIVHIGSLICMSLADKIIRILRIFSVIAVGNDCFYFSLTVML